MNPHPLSAEEWREIANVPEVRNAWGLDDQVDASQFASIAYGVRFNFVSGSPGYVGDLFILHGDALTGDPPLVLRRDAEGKLLALRF